MAATVTSVSLKVPAPPSAPHDGSSSNVSSPLSDVDDKDGDSDSLDLGVLRKGSDNEGDLGGREGSAGDLGSDGDEDDEESRGNDDDDDDDSNLSDVDINDSEAETERLHNSPLKPNTATTPASSSSVPGSKRHSNPREHTFESSPTKPSQPYRTGRGRDIGAREDIISLSGKEESGSELSVTTSGDNHTAGHLRIAKNRPGAIDGASVVMEANTPSLSDSRKRKRSPAAGHADGSPLRKRVGSVPTGAVGTEDMTTAGSVVDEALAKHRSGEQSHDEASSMHRMDQGNDEDVNGTSHVAQYVVAAATRPKRTVTRKHKDAHDRAGGNNDGRMQDRVEDVPGQDNAHTRKGDGLPAEHKHGDDYGDGDLDGDMDGDPDHDGDMDGEADRDGADGDVDQDCDGYADPEASHKDEEELERRRSAREFIHELEKSFAKFRDQYYEERIRVLNEEEVMLTAPEPTHPEFLAMMQSVDARRDETLRIVDAEYRLGQEALHRWAVARRAQILSQYYQTVRESRERVLEELGNEWYRIQQQRRRYANNVPDFNLPFPETRPKALRQAIAYNKEVSILSGLAKHRGFPAAPDITGATVAEVEEDLDEIAQARHGAWQSVAMATPFQDYGAMPNERSLGPAGEEFLKQTPWANPNHPSHHTHAYAHTHSRPREVPRSSSPVPGPSGPGESFPSRRASQTHAQSGTVLIPPGGSPSALPRFNTEAARETNAAIGGSQG